MDAVLDKISALTGDGIHDTDLMLWFTGAKIVSAYAQTVDLRGKKYPDIGQTMYRFDNGATATLARDRSERTSSTSPVTETPSSRPSARSTSGS